MQETNRIAWLMARTLRAMTWMALITCGLAGGATRAGADLREIKARGRLRVLAVTSEDSDYFYCTNPSRNPGFDREILEGYAHLNRIELDTLTVPTWDQLIPALLEGKGDVIAGAFTMTAARRQFIDFSVEAFPTRNVILTRKPHPAVKTLDALRALAKVGTVRSEAMKDALLEAGIPASRIVELENGVADGLRQERVLAAIESLEMALISSRQDPNLEMGVFIGPHGSLAYGVRKEDVELRTSLSAYVNNMRRGAGWNRLVVKYFGEQSLQLLRLARPE